MTGEYYEPRVFLPMYIIWTLGIDPSWSREDHPAASLKAYRDNKRKGIDTSTNEVMHPVTDADTQALAHYLWHE